MKYEKRWFCVNCKKPMSWHTKMQSHGCCPMCGLDSGDTVCNTFEKSVAVNPNYIERFMDGLAKIIGKV